MYHARHRKPTHRGRVRAVTVAAVTASALVAPMAVNPAASTAAVTTLAFDTLANHPGWGLSAADPAVAALVTNLRQAYTTRDVRLDPSMIAAYRVPTVEGFETFVTSQPQMFRIEPNPNLIEHTPDGDKSVDPALVLSRLISADAQGVGGLPLSGVYLEDVFTEYETLGATLASLINGVITQVIGYANDPQWIIGTLNELLDIVRNLYINGINPGLGDLIPTVDPNTLVAGAQYAVGVVLGVIDLVINSIPEPPNSNDITGLVQPYVDMIPTTDELQQQVQTYLNQVPPPPDVDPQPLVTEIQAVLAEEVDDLMTAAGLSDTDLQSVTEQIVSVLPIASAAPPPVADNVYADPTFSALPKPEKENGGNPRWTTQDTWHDCFNVHADNGYDRLVCYRIDWQQNDNSGTYNYWQFHLDAGGNSLYPRNMKRLWVEAQPNPDGNQQFDAQPIPRATYGGSDGCTTNGETFTVSSGGPVQVGYGYYWERTSCETYTPKSYSDEGHWASIWEGNEVVNDDVRRYVLAKIPVKTAQDKGVQWTLLTGQFTVR